MFRSSALLQNGSGLHLFTVKISGNYRYTVVHGGNVGEYGKMLTPDSRCVLHEGMVHLDRVVLDLKSDAPPSIRHALTGRTKGTQDTRPRAGSVMKLSLCTPVRMALLKPGDTRSVFTSTPCLRAWFKNSMTKTKQNKKPLQPG